MKTMREVLFHINKRCILIHHRVTLILIDRIRFPDSYFSYSVKTKISPRSKPILVSSKLSQNQYQYHKTKNLGLGACLNGRHSYISFHCVSNTEFWRKLLKAQNFRLWIRVTRTQRIYQAHPTYSWNVFQKYNFFPKEFYNDLIWFMLRFFMNWTHLQAFFTHLCSSTWCWLFVSLSIFSSSSSIT